MALLIQLTKRRDGSSALQCVRADGSKTWQRHNGRQASFFPLHDLTHYAVESELGFQQGFYGLIAAGWEIEDTGGKGARGPLPAETVTVEHIVGVMDAERASGEEWTAAELNAHGAVGRSLTDAELARVRARVRELVALWAVLEPGGTLELVFGSRPDLEARL